MSNDFTNFFKGKLLKLMTGQKKITDDTPRQLNQNVFLNYGINQTFKFLGENFSNFEIINKISFGNVIITAGNYWETNTPLLKKGFFVLSDEFENIIPVEYENTAGVILKIKIMTTFNNKNVEDFLPQFLTIKNNKSNFLFGIVKELNGDIKIVKFNNFTEYFFTPFTIFYFKDMKMNTSFIFDEAEPPIDFTNQVNTADYFKVEENFRNVNHIDVIFWKSISNSQARLFLMSFQLDQFILKYISTPDGYVLQFDTSPETMATKYLFEFGAAATDNDAYIGYVIFQNGYSTITINPNLKYILLFSPTASLISPFSMPGQYGSSVIPQLLFIDYDRFFCFAAIDIPRQPPRPEIKNTFLYYCEKLNPYKIENGNNNGTILSVVVFPPLIEMYYPFILLNQKPKLEPYFKLNRVWDQTKKSFLVTFKGLCYLENTTPTEYINCTGYIYYIDQTPYINPTFKLIDANNLELEKVDYVLCLKQQNRIVTMTGIHQSTTPTQRFNFLKTQSTYNLGDINSSPSFYTRIDNDLQNFFIVHAIGVFNNLALAADINIIDFTNNNNNLIYSATLERNTMNYLDNNNWMLISNTEQIIFNKSLTIQKSIFEEKNLNFVISFLINLVERQIFSNEYASLLTKIFIVKNDISVLENLAISDIILTFQSGKAKKVNILKYWVLDEFNFTLSINVLINVLNKNDLPISYKLVSFNETLIYQTDIKNFGPNNLLEIKHKIYYN